MGAAEDKVDQMDDETIRKIVKVTIEELKRNGFLQRNTDFAYAEISSMLTAYYQDGEGDDLIRKAVKDAAADPYGKSFRYIMITVTPSRRSLNFTALTSAPFTETKNACVYKSITLFNEPQKCGFFDLILDLTVAQRCAIVFLCPYEKIIIGKPLYERKHHHADHRDANRRPDPV